MIFRAICITKPINNCMRLQLFFDLKSSHQIVCIRSLSMRNEPRVVTKESIEKAFQNIKSVVSQKLSEFKGTVLESLGKRMSRKDAEILHKYVQKIYDADESPKLPDNSEQIDTKDVSDSSNIESVKTLAEALVVNKEIVPEVSIDHPIFGKLIADLGYKSVYVTSIKRIALTPVWEKQRILRPDRSARIASSKIKSGTASRLSGVITMFQDTVSGKIGIVDGQHRAGALLMLAQQGHWNESQNNILLDVFNTQSEDEVVSLFYEINSAEPVRFIDLNLPQHLADENEDSLTEEMDDAKDISIKNDEGNVTQVIKLSQQDIKQIITAAVDELSTKYSVMFKPTSRCRPPHLNVDVLRDDLFRAEFLNKHKISSADQLLAKLLEINSKLGIKYAVDNLNQNDTPKSKTTEQAEAKAKNNNFYLGLADRSWLIESV